MIYFLLNWYFRKNMEFKIFKYKCNLIFFIFFYIFDIILKK